MNTLMLFLVGASHRTAPFGFRERLALGTEAEAGFAHELAGMRSLCEFAVLNTCNRIEIYGVANEECVPDQVVTTLCARQNVDPVEFGRWGFVARGRDAIQHLLEVACGLDSQILGETEIFGQVKRAYATALARGSAGAVLNRLFQGSFRGAKRVRTHTGVTSGNVSVANVAVDLACNTFGRLEGARVLLLGAGEMGEKSGRAFASRGVREMTVCSRRMERATQLASELGAGVLRFEERDARLADWDIVVCSTAAPETVVSAEAVRAAMKDRPARPILFVDLAMPRDVDAAVVDTSNVFLYNLDDLAGIAERNRLARRAEAESGRRILVPYADLLWHRIETQLVSGDGEGNSSTREAPFPRRGLPAPAIA